MKNTIFARKERAKGKRVILKNTIIASVEEIFRVLMMQSEKLLKGKRGARRPNSEEDPMLMTLPVV